jgi:hypothetical protein
VLLLRVGGSLMNGWMDGSPLLGRPRGCIYALGEPWGVLHLALDEIFLGREGNLVSIKSLVQIFLICSPSLPAPYPSRPDSK